jgi:hypothetical protein
MSNVKNRIKPVRRIRKGSWALLYIPLRVNSVSKGIAAKAAPDELKFDKMSSM